MGQTMKKLLTAGAVLALTLVATTTMAAANPMYGLTMSSNVGNVDMNCKANNGGTGSAILISSATLTHPWGKISKHFHGANMQCQFSLDNAANTLVGSAQLIVKSIPNQPGALCGTFLKVTSAPSYILTATGSQLAPLLQSAFFNYTVTMNSTSRK